MRRTVLSRQFAQARAVALGSQEEGAAAAACQGALAIYPSRFVFWRWAGRWAGSIWQAGRPREPEVGYEKIPYTVPAKLCRFTWFPANNRTESPSSPHFQAPALFMLAVPYAFTRPQRHVCTAASPCSLYEGPFVLGKSVALLHPILRIQFLWGFAQQRFGTAKPARPRRAAGPEAATVRGRRSAAARVGGTCAPSSRRDFRCPACPMFRSGLRGGGRVAVGEWWGR